jgi:hypothetical protein
MNCAGCGSENPDIATFCFSCGARLPRTEASATREAAGLRVRMTPPPTDPGTTDTASQMAATPAPRDRRMGLAETAPFSESPLVDDGRTTDPIGRDTQPEARVGANVADTIIEMPTFGELIEAERERRERAKALAGHAPDGDNVRLSDDVHGDPAWTRDEPERAASSSHREPAWSDVPARSDGARTQPEPKKGEAAILLSDSAAKSAATRGSHAWTEGVDAGDSLAGDSFAFEMQQARKVKWTHRALVFLIVAFLAGAAFFVYRGFVALRAASSRTIPSVTPSAFSSGTAPTSSTKATTLATPPRSKARATTRASLKAPWRRSACCASRTGPPWMSFVARSA